MPPTGSEFNLGQLVLSGLKEITQYLNPMLAIIASALTQMLKPIVLQILPDKLEAALTDTCLRIVAMFICIVFGIYAMHLNFLTTFTTGVLTCTCYQLIASYLPTKKDDTPIPPVVK
jgi:hypothetical protein